MKRCSICLRDLPLDSFHKHAKCRDGHVGQCRECLAKRSAEYQRAHAAEIKAQKAGYRRQNPEAERTRKNAWIAANRDHHRRLVNAATRAYKSRNPEKVRAHHAVSNAIRHGRLVRPEACERCGAPGIIEAHHADYAKPLDVEWLCVPCHEAEHAQARTA